MKHVNYFDWESRGLWGHGKGFLTLMGKIRNPSPGKLISGKPTRWEMSRRCPGEEDRNACD